jgi:AAA domain
MAVSLRKASGPKQFQRRIFLYGKSGAGKTHFIGSASEVKELREILVLPLDAGDATLDGSDVIVADGVRRLREVEEVLWAVSQKQGDYANIKMLVLDGISEAAKRELQDIAELGAKNTEKSSKPRDRDLNQLQDHMLKNGRLMRVVRMARDIPGITLVLTGWPKEVYKVIDDMPRTDLPAISIGPDFSDKLVDTLLGSMDDVWFIRQEADGRRFLYTGNHENIRAKTRGAEFAEELGTTKDGKFFPIMVEPTLEKIVAAFDRAAKKKTAPKETK